MKLRISPFVIDNQVQFEAEESPHGTFSTLCKTFKGFVNQDALVTTYP